MSTPAPLFMSTTEAEKFGERMDEATAEFVAVRRKVYLDSASDSVSKGENNRALRQICSAQFDREAIEAYERRKLNT